MQDNFSWVHLDTETNGISSPIFVVDIAVQKMKGWEPDGLPIQMCINHGIDIPPEASRVNGYTREILERDGVCPYETYERIRNYIKDLPVSSYNLKFDWDKVLIKEWQRIGVEPIGVLGIFPSKKT